MQPKPLVIGLLIHPQYLYLLKYLNVMLLKLEFFTNIFQGVSLILIYLLLFLEFTGHHSLAVYLQFGAISYNYIPFRNNGKWFLFHVKSFCFLNIYVFALTFQSWKKRDDKKSKVNSKIYDVTYWKAKKV